MNLLIINPNISAATNARIRAIAGALIKAPDEVEVVSAPSGIEFIETVEQSVATVPAVLSVVRERHERADAIIIAAFSDPGLAEARKASSCPVFGISEAAMKMAVGVADRFVIITLGGELGEAIKTNAEIYGVAENLTEVRILPWTVTEVSADPPAHEKAFAEACQQAVAEGGVGAVIIGGGPLSGIADSIADDLPIPVLDGVRCAVTLTQKLWRERRILC